MKGISDGRALGELLFATVIAGSISKDNKFTIYTSTNLNFKLEIGQQNYVKRIHIQKTAFSTP